MSISSGISGGIGNSVESSISRSGMVGGGGIVPGDIYILDENGNYIVDETGLRLILE